MRRETDRIFALECQRLLFGLNLDYWTLLNVSVVRSEQASERRRKGCSLPAAASDGGRVKKTVFEHPGFWLWQADFKKWRSAGE